MQARLASAAFYVAGSLANLPLVYAVLRAGEASPRAVLGFGLASMSLAWCAGFVVERKWRVAIWPISLAGAAELPLAFWRPVLDAVPGARPWLVLAGGATLLGFALSTRADVAWMRRAA